MDNGIRSATAVPHGSAAATLETSGPPASPLITAEGPTAVGILLARPGALLRFAAALVSEPRISADLRSAILLSLDRVLVTPRSDLFRTRASGRRLTRFVAPDSIPLAATADLATEGLGVDWAGAETVFEGTADTVTVGREVSGPAMAGAAAFSGRALVGAGEVGALAWDGRTGRMDGIRGGTTPTGIRLGRTTTTTRTTPGTTIRHRMIPTLGMTTIRGRVTRSRRGRMRQPYTSMSVVSWATDCASTPEGCPAQALLGRGFFGQYTQF